MDKRPDCGSVHCKVVLEPEGSVHHARFVCEKCGRFFRWLKKPQKSGALPDPAIMAKVQPGQPPVTLRGTEKQVKYAMELRSKLVFILEHKGQMDKVDLVNGIEDATWFLAQKGKPLKNYRWPVEKQMAIDDESMERLREGNPPFGDPSY